jgi:hypothetical protein
LFFVSIFPLMLDIAFEDLRPLGFDLADRLAKAFAEYASGRGTYSEELRLESLGSNLGLWLEKSVMAFLEDRHGLPPIDDRNLPLKRNRKKYGPLEYRIDRAAQAAGAKGYIKGAMHQIRDFRNNAVHKTPADAEDSLRNASKVSDWLVQQYAASREPHLPVYTAPPTNNYPTEAWPDESDYVPFTYDNELSNPQPSSTPRSAAAPRATAPPPKIDPSYIGENFYKPEFASDPFPTRRPVSTSSWSGEDFGVIAFIAAILLVGAFVVWFSYRVVVAVGDVWAGIPSFTRIVAAIPKPTWSEPKQLSVAERIQPVLPPPPPRTSTQQQSPVPQITPAPLPPPPIAQLKCPPGTLFDSYTSQCTFAPENDQASAGPALSIHPECPPGSSYSDQSSTCVIIEANNECPSGTYLTEGTQQCVTKRKYGFFRYEQQQTLLAGTFVQAPPVDETYAINVLAGSLRIYYLEDPASAKNVVRSGHGRHIYNYAIISCVLCPATFVTNRVQ